jgi:cytoskeletal protein CcmA (bactofilin family)
MTTQSGALLSRGVSIKGSVKFLNELFIDGEVEGTIDSTGTLTTGSTRGYAVRSGRNR